MCTYNIGRIFSDQTFKSMLIKLKYSKTDVENINGCNGVNITNIKSQMDFRVINDFTWVMSHYKIFVKTLGSFNLTTFNNLLKLVQWKEDRGLTLVIQELRGAK